MEGLPPEGARVGSPEHGPSMSSARLDTELSSGFAAHPLPMADGERPSSARAATRDARASAAAHAEENAERREDPADRRHEQRLGDRELAEKIGGGEARHGGDGEDRDRRLDVTELRLPAHLALRPLPGGRGLLVRDRHRDREANIPAPRAL